MSETSVIGLKTLSYRVNEEAGERFLTIPKQQTLSGVLSLMGMLEGDCKAYSADNISLKNVEIDSRGTDTINGRNYDIKRNGQISDGQEFGIKKLGSIVEKPNGELELRGEIVSLLNEAGAFPKKINEQLNAPSLAEYQAAQLKPAAKLSDLTFAVDEVLNPDPYARSSYYSHFRKADHTDKSKSYEESTHKFLIITDYENSGLSPKDIGLAVMQKIEKHCQSLTGGTGDAQLDSTHELMRERWNNKGSSYTGQHDGRYKDFADRLIIEPDTGQFPGTAYYHIGAGNYADVGTVKVQTDGVVVLSGDQLLRRLVATEALPPEITAQMKAQSLEAYAQEQEKATGLDFAAEQKKYYKGPDKKSEIPELADSHHGKDLRQALINEVHRLGRAEGGDAQASKLATMHVNKMFTAMMDAANKAAEGNKGYQVEMNKEQIQTLAKEVQTAASKDLENLNKLNKENKERTYGAFRARSCSPEVSKVFAATMEERFTAAAGEAAKPSIEAASDKYISGQAKNRIDLEIGGIASRMENLLSVDSNKSFVTATQKHVQGSHRAR